MLGAVLLTSLYARAEDRVADEVLTLHESDYLYRVYQAVAENHADSLARMIELTEVPAPPFGEQARAARLLDLFIEAGLETARIDATGNVLARRPGLIGDRTVAVIAHIDTVFPAGTDVTVRREGAVYSAPGIGDNTRGVTLMVDLVLAMAELPLQSDVLFVGSVGEEGLGDLSGVRALFAEGGPAIDSVIVVDGGPLQNVVTTAVGSNRYRVTYRGPGGHSYGSFGLVHPHQALAEAIARFTTAARAITESPGAKATFSVGRIGGGTSINSIPFESWMEVDMRSPDPERLAALDAAFHEAIQEALAAENNQRFSDAKLTVDVLPVGRRPAGSTPESAELVRRARAAFAAFGVDIILTASSTDANVPMSLGIPAITVARGGISRDAHALTERWEDVGATKAASAIALLLTAEAGLSVTSD